LATMVADTILLELSQYSAEVDCLTIMVGSYKLLPAKELDLTHKVHVAQLVMTH